MHPDQDSWEDNELFNNLERACHANEIQFSLPEHMEAPAAARASGAELERGMQDMPVIEIEVCSGRLA